MQGNKVSLRLAAILATIVFTVLVSAGRAFGQEERILWNFNYDDGLSPSGALIFDAAGNLYGTAYEGGASHECDIGCGIAFELSPKPDGGWAFKLLHNFGDGEDGQNPAAGVILDAEGNLYGTTRFGGPNRGGTVFELSPRRDGTWSESILHSFGGVGETNPQPMGNLVFDSAGNLYGTTSWGGAYDYGTVFQLRKEHGQWGFTVLHDFGNGEDGQNPMAGVVFDSAGNLYSTTEFGGSISLEGGTVFQLTPQADGRWTESILWNFGSELEGSMLEAGVILDSAGNLYGMTYYGGDNHMCFSGLYNGCGTVFELKPPAEAGANWRKEELHAFAEGTKDGRRPFASLIFDPAGNLYGTTGYGGVYGLMFDSGGTVFEMKRRSDGEWSELVLHNFGNGVDGAIPGGSLFRDTAGILYGNTIYGGAGNDGTLFQIFPH